MIERKKKFLAISVIFLSISLGASFSYFFSQNQKSKGINEKYQILEKKIMIFGSSHSYCNYIQNGPSTLLQHTIIDNNKVQLRFNVSNLSLGSAVPADFINGIMPFCNISNYDYVILELTTSAYGIEIHEFYDQMDFIIRNILGNHSVPVLQTSVYLDYPTHYPGKRNEYIYPYNQIFYNLSSKYNIPMVDVLARFKAEIQNGNWDLFIRNMQYPISNISHYSNTHPNQRGQFYIYQEIVKAISADLNISVQIDDWEHEASLFYSNFIFQITPPILIENDKDWDKLKELSFIEGNGSQNKPYIIENKNFLISDNDGITIRNTSKYFVIHHCIMGSINCHSFTFSISLENVTHGIIRNNNFIYGRSAISVKNSSDITISKNNFTFFSENAIDISFVSGITIEKNKIYSNYHGLRVYFSENVVIYSNRFVENYIEAISVIHSQDTNILNNFMINNQVNQINLYESNYIECDSNICYNSSFGLASGNVNFSKFQSNFFAQNTITGVKFWDWAKSSIQNYILNNTFFENVVGFQNINVNYPNYISLNKFIDNDRSIINNYPNVRFDYNNSGNYYSDHENIDLNGDGFTDSIYVFNLNLNIIDNFPLYISPIQCQRIIDYYIVKLK